MVMITRLSKQLITAPGEKKLPSSAVLKVVSSDDLLIEILLRLPVSSIHVFKFVSKRWLSLITSPSFTLRRSQIPSLDPPSGLFIRIENSFIYHFVSLDPRIPSSRYLLQTTCTFGLEGVKSKVLQSCNGLLLICRPSFISIKPDTIYVYNPSVNLFKILPQCHSFSFNIKMAFDPTKSPHYKVVYVKKIDDDDDDDDDAYIQVQIYSSETGNWSFSSDRFPCESFISFENGIYWNDAIHWVSNTDKCLLFKLDMIDRLVLTTMRTPQTLDGMVYYNCKLFESRGRLLFVGAVSYHFRNFNVYEMMNGSSEWSINYTVNHDDIVFPFPNSWISDIWSIVLGEREEDSFMVLQLHGRVVVEYNIRLNTIGRKLYDLGLVSPRGCFQFIASFASV